MQTIFLTSFIGGFERTPEGKQITNINNSNHFIDRLKSIKDNWRSLVIVSSDPDGFAKSDEYANIFTKAFKLDGINIENVTILDHRFKGNIEKTILDADVLFLNGGNTTTQNKYLKEINLNAILPKFEGVIIGQSAGSMNLSKTVYAPPEYKEDLTDKYQRVFSGIGLTDIRIMPHMDTSFTDNVNGLGKNTIDYCLEDSYRYPMYGLYDYSFIEITPYKTTCFGKALLIKDGKFTKVCENNESIEINNLYNDNENIK